MNSQGLIEKFIYSCSHDLRAPVSSIQGLVRIAQYYPLHDEVHQCLEMIEACAHDMDKRISNLQEYMVNHQQPLHMEPLNPADLIQEIKTEFKNQLDTFHIDLIADVKSETPWVMDKTGAQKILRYLVTNCIAYHDPEKKERRINIRIESVGPGSILEVSDNGKGIPGDQQERIFDVFHRGTEFSIGQGMGLFLTKSLVEKMGGTIECESEVNSGTAIRLVFPVVELSLV